MRVPVTVRLETQAPASQVWPAPQAVPSATGAPVSAQVGPLEQDVVPRWHGFEGVQAAPATQETQAPALQTWSPGTPFVSQAVPSASAAPVSTHCCVPVAQEVAPARHGFGFVAQASPETHATQAPPLQTSSSGTPFVSQVFPSRGVVESMQTA
jgi:hypothetical protein